MLPTNTREITDAKAIVTPNGLSTKVTDADRRIEQIKVEPNDQVAPQGEMHTTQPNIMNCTTSEKTPQPSRSEGGRTLPFSPRCNPYSVYAQSLPL